MSKFSEKESVAFHKGIGPDGKLLDPDEREEYFKRFLPTTPNSHSPSPARGDGSLLQFTKPSQQTSQAQTQSSNASDTTKRKQSSSQKRHRQKPVRTLMMSQLHLLIYTLIHFFFGIYIRVRRVYRALVNRVYTVLYYHHRTPELIAKDVARLDRVPEHLSIMLALREDEGLEGLLEDVAEVAAWCCSAQIPMLSVYEKSGTYIFIYTQVDHDT